MRIMIERDGGATRVEKDVADEAAAVWYQQQGFTVYTVEGEGDKQVCTPFVASQAAPADEPADEPDAPAKKTAKKKA